MRRNVHTPTPLAFMLYLAVGSEAAESDQDSISAPAAG